MNALNDELVKDGPLSVTIFCGRPCVANRSLSLAMVFSNVMEFISCTSSHFEYASTVTMQVHMS